MINPLNKLYREGFEANRAGVPMLVDEPNEAWKVGWENAAHMFFPAGTIYWYDIEAFQNFFSICIERDTDGAKWQFEISPWYHQGRELSQLLSQIANSGGRMAGYNNYGFDYPVMHMILQQQGMIDALTIKYKANSIIEAGNRGDRFSNIIWDNDQFVPQLDLMKIHHFDNKAKATSLKLLEFNMRMDDIIELPYPHDKELTFDESRYVLQYNWHDVTATKRFGRLSTPMIEFRDKLTEKYNKNFTNHNDTKIGADFFVMRLADAGIRANKRTQTPRVCVAAGDIILPYIQFEHPEFQRILNFFRAAVIPTEGDGIKSYFSQFEQELTADLDGFHVVFGGGGIHASLSTTIIDTTDTHRIVDSDVASFYPNLAITNNFYPEHLTDKFCEIYLGVYLERKSYPKKTAENNMMKLALNGVYGKSNDIHSPFLDPKYTLSTTINGQLLLCMLAEQLIKVPGLKMIQMNTDGLTYACPHECLDHCMKLSEWWEDLTKLELEHAPYTRMCIRDVNNYMAMTDKFKIAPMPSDGSIPDDFAQAIGNRQYITVSKDKNQYVKRIGAYAHERIEENPGTRELTWNKDHSMIVVAKAAEAALMYGKDIGEFIRNHDDVFDFFLRTKVPRNSHLLAGEERVQNVTRYYVSTDGVALTKVMPPTDKLIEKWNTVPHWKHRENGKTVNAKKAPSGKYDLVPKPSPFPPDRQMSIQKGWLVTVCNSVKSHTFENINYDYYIAEAKKLVDELRT